MLNRSFIPCAVAVLLGAGLLSESRAWGQEPRPNESPAAGAMVHFAGCLFTEPELTATMPVVVAEGSTHDWVLTHVKEIAGSVPEAEAAKTIYTLTKADQAQLRALHGKSVGVTGRIGAGPKRPHLEVVSIREISGGCPVLPSLQ